MMQTVQATEKAGSECNLNIGVPGYWLLVIITYSTFCVSFFMDVHTNLLRIFYYFLVTRTSSGNYVT